jgi:radical SAM superfamily enzyme YgiQ (UPF0313 family)
LKVLLVNPACLDRRITDDDARVVPIGLYYLAAQLLDSGVAAGIINLAGVAMDHDSNAPGADDQASPAVARTFQAALAQEKPDIVGFSVTNPSRFSAMACARQTKALLPDAIVVFGGPAPTFMADHLFTACPDLDIAVRGEAEQTLVQLVRAIEKNKHSPAELTAIKGLVFRTGSGLEDTGLPDPIENLDHLARPSKYFAFQHLAMSRGCPGRCTFCGSPKFWGSGRVRRHSADWFFREILALNQQGISHFFISDDTFTMDRDAVIQLCKKIIESGLSITWNAISRVDYVDKGLLTAMRRAGCIQISFGVESGDTGIRKTLGKPLDEAACVRAFDLTRSLGILPRAYFIYGSPGETHETIDQSIDLIKRLKPLGMVSYMLVVFPGTHLYTRARDKKLVTDDIWFQRIEDLPWFELDPNLDFFGVKTFGDRLRQAFYATLSHAALSLELEDDKALYPFHADFLSRLAMTFSQGEYADPVSDARAVARQLFEQALAYAMDPRACLGLSMIRQKDGDMPGAADLLEQGLKCFPGHRDLSVGMGVCLMNMGQFSQALDCFTPFDRDPSLRQYIDICNSRITH